MADGLGELVAGYIQGQQLQAQKAREITERQLQASKLQLEQQAARDRLAQQSIENTLALQELGLKKTTEERQSKAQASTEKHQRAMEQQNAVNESGRQFRAKMRAFVQEKGLNLRNKQHADTIRRQIMSNYINKGVLEPEALRRTEADMEALRLGIPETEGITALLNAIGGGTAQSQSPLTPEGTQAPLVDPMSLLINGGLKGLSAPASAAPGAVPSPDGTVPAPAAPNPSAVNSILQSFPNVLRNPSAPLLPQVQGETGGVTPGIQRQEDILSKWGLGDQKGIQLPLTDAKIKATEAGIAQKQQAVKESIERTKTYQSLIDLRGAQKDLDRAILKLDGIRGQEALQKMKEDALKAPLTRAEMEARGAYLQQQTQKVQEQVEKLHRENEFVKGGDLLSDPKWVRDNANDLEKKRGKLSADIRGFDADTRQTLREYNRVLSRINNPPMNFTLATPAPYPPDSPQYRQWQESIRPADPNNPGDAGGEMFQQKVRMQQLLKSQQEMRDEAAADLSETTQAMKGAGILRNTTGSGKPASIVPFTPQVIRPTPTAPHYNQAPAKSGGAQKTAPKKANSKTHDLLQKMYDKLK